MKSLVLKRFSRLIISTTAVLGIAIGGMGIIYTPQAKAQESHVNKLVEYDFSQVKDGDNRIHNSVKNSPFADAIIQDSDGPVAAQVSHEALNFNGKYFVKLPDDILKNQKSATVSTVIKNDEFNSSGPWSYVWSLGSTGQAGKGSWATSTHTSLYSSITSQANGDGETYFSASRNLPMDKFVNLTATINGESHIVKLYINGQEVGSTKASASPSDFKDHSHNVIGESRYPGVGDAFFHGQIKSFTIFSGELTQQQIAETLSPVDVTDLLNAQVNSISAPQSVQSDFTVPVTTQNGNIKWSSSHPDTIAIDDEGKATVAQPLDHDVLVNLTATVTPFANIAMPDKPVVQTFVVTVAQKLNEQLLRQKLSEQIKLDKYVDTSNILGDFLLPNSASLEAYGVRADVSWKLSKPQALSVESKRVEGSSTYAATVNRTKKKQKVVLTAKIISSSLLTPLEVSNVVYIAPVKAGPSVSHTRVTSHDPSIIKANGKYYIFGSHRAFARSTDLKHWEYFTNNLSTDYENLLGDIWNAWPKQDSNPELSGNMWAPEVVWNKTMHKWCMYLSINGGGFPYQKTVMVLLTASDIEGDWTYVGPVAYSGFQPSNASATDVYKVLGQNADLTRYSSLEDTGINIIDASVKYDDNGDMWMAFGSWFGGIWMIKLDPATGLRDYSYTYKTIPHVSDAYYGYKLAGGFGNSGEGVALIKKGEWWYMMLSYGGLSQTGGYQMREFRSRSIYGPYLDQNGNSAVYTQKVANDMNVNRGLRILTSYQQPGTQDVYTAQGGNALLVDDDGAIYNVYHTRFVRTQGNLEEHQVRVNEMMITQDGWLVASPYEYSAPLKDASFTKSQIVGDFNVVVNSPYEFYAGSGLDSTAVYKSKTVTFQKDGSLAGSAQGTWNLDKTGKNISINIVSSQSDVNLSGQYTARLAYQVTETGQSALVFSGLGGNTYTNAGSDVSASAGRTAFWGVRIVDIPLPDLFNSEVPNHSEKGTAKDKKDKKEKKAKKNKKRHEKKIRSWGLIPCWRNYLSKYMGYSYSSYAPLSHRHMCVYSSSRKPVQTYRSRYITQNGNRLHYYISIP